MKTAIIVMNKMLKHYRLKKLLPLIIIFAVILILTIALAAVGILHIISGPQKIETVAELKEGNYVEFDASEIIVQFATLTAKNGNGDEKELKSYYLLRTGDTYIAVVDENGKNSSLMKRAMEQSQHYYYAKDLDELTSLGEISGTIGTLETGMESYMVSCIEQYELPGYEEGSDTHLLITPVQINLGRVGFLTVRQTVVLAVCALVSLIALAAVFIIVFSGLLNRSLFKELDEIEDHDALLSSAEQVERVYVSDYIFYPKGIQYHAIPIETLVWAYDLPEPLVVSKYRWPAVLCNDAGKTVKLSFEDKKNTGNLISLVKERVPALVTGYTIDMERKYQEDPEGFAGKELTDEAEQ